MNMGVRPGRWLVVLALLPLWSCSLGRANENEIRAADVYEEVLRWLVDNADDERTPVEHEEQPMAVFIEPRGEGAAISLDVQAELVEKLSDVADIRFLDERNEGLVEQDGLVRVKDDGILIRLGPVIEDDAHVLLDVDIWETVDTFSEVRFELRRSGNTWAVQGPPDPIDE